MYKGYCQQNEQANSFGRKGYTNTLEAKQEKDLERLVASQEKATATLVQQHEKAIVAKDVANDAERIRAEKQIVDLQQNLLDVKTDHSADVEKREQQAEQLGEFKAKLAAMHVELAATQKAAADANKTIKTLQKPKKKA